MNGAEIAELAYGKSVTEKAAGLAGLRVARNIGVDGQVESIEHQIDSAVAVSVTARGADSIGRKEIEMPADVEVVLAEVSGRHLENSSAIHCLGPPWLESIRFSVNIADFGKVISRWRVHCFEARLCAPAAEEDGDD